MTALPVLMFQIELLRVFCSYCHAYIILLEAGTDIHVSVYDIIAKNPIRRHHHTSIYFRVFDKKNFSFSYLNCNNLISMLYYY